MVSKILFSLIKIFLATFLLYSTPVFSAINVSIDRQLIMADESFQIIFESTESVGEPDFSPLKKDFEILTTRQSSNTTVINGRVESKKSWILDVIAKRAGKIFIPSVKFGQKQTQALLVNISKNDGKQSKNTNEDIFFEVEIDTETPYVQQQVIFTIRLFLGVAINNASLSEPDLKGVDAVIQKLGEDKNYETRRSNKRYVVYERRYAIFPQASGDIEIDPITFQGRQGSDSRFFNNFLNQSGKVVVKRTEPISLKVQTVPTRYQGEYWLPAQNMQITETWPEVLSGELPVFRVGEPVTRNITLQAQGLTASQLPELKTQLSDDFKQYPDQPMLQDQVTEKGIGGIRAEKIAIIPGTAGEFTLPEVVIPWWNTETDQQAFARLPEKVISVLPAKSSTVTDLSSIQPEENSGSDSENIPSELKRSLSKEIGFDDSDVYQDSSHWNVLSIFLATGWLLTLFLWLWVYFRKSRIKGEDEDEKEYSSRKVMSEIKRACTDNDLVRTKEALLTWARHNWPEDPVANLGEISKHCHERVANEINTVNRLLYSEETLPWDGKALWNVMQEYQHQSRPPRKENDSGLEPLYRL